jgi:HlyD family secretion protein
VRKGLIKLVKISVKLAVLLGLGIGAWYAYQIYIPVEEDDGLGELPTAISAIRDITMSVEAIGVLRPITIVEIKSRASGEILEMGVETGDFVEVGDLIAQVDTEILDQEFRQVQADFENALVRLEVAENQHERSRALFGEYLISENDFESSEQTFSTAQGQLLRAEASLDLARERLTDATVRAPSAGTIINKTVEEGQIIASSTNDVSGGTTLVQMADLTRLEIRTLVDEVDIGQIQSGLSVVSKVEAFPEEQFLGEVMKIEPQAVVQRSVTTFPVLSRIDNAAGKLLPGMNADVSIVVHRKPGVLTIQNEAVRTPSDAVEVAAMLGFATVEKDDVGGGTGGRGGSDNVDQKAQFESASPAERQRMMEEFRKGGNKADSDPFGLDGRREYAVVFVYDELGQIMTKKIVVGVRDWQNTEVLEGLNPGEEVLLLPSTSLLRNQDRLRSWAQGRSGIPGLSGKR